MLDLTPAAELRAAAAKLRSRAIAASAAPWRRSGIGDFGWTVHLGLGQSVETEDSEQGRANADWIALMNPTVGLALAEWLERTVRALEYWRTAIPDEALAVARSMNTPTEEQH